MVTSKAVTVAQVLASLPADRREAIAAIRAVILDNLPEGYEESIQFGMIAYSVPLSRFPDTYNGQPLQLAALASQKSHMSLYLMVPYGHAETRRWFEAAWKKAGKKLDMGKSCLRFRSLDDLALDVIGQLIARVPVDEYLRVYEATRRGAPAPKRTAKKASVSAPARRRSRSGRPSRRA